MKFWRGNTSLHGNLSQISCVNYIVSKIITPFIIYKSIHLLETSHHSAVCQLLTSQAAVYHRQSVNILVHASENEGTEWSQYLEKTDLHLPSMKNYVSQPIACQEQKTWEDFRLDGRPQDWSWDLYLIFLEITIKTLLIADL